MAEIRPTTFADDTAIELTTNSLRLVVITSRGPRIAFFGKPGDNNLLLWKPGEYGHGNWDLMGGHRLWISRPGADEAEETYAPDNAPCTVETFPDGFTVHGTRDPHSLVTRGFTVRALADDCVEVEHFARNDGIMLYSGGLWGLTCSVPSPNTTYHVPLGDGSEWDTATIVAFKRWGGGHGHSGGFGDPQFTTTDDALVLKPAGRENKRMIRADAGTIAMHDPDRGTLFAIHTRYQQGAHYPLGTNLALYVGPDNFMVEMETMSPFAELKPGQSVHHTETWILREAGATPPAIGALRNLLS